MSAIDRRELLRLGVGGAAVLSMTACGSSAIGEPRPRMTTSPRPAASGQRLLVAYFSRPGENWWNGGRHDLQVGNTQVLAGLIADRVQCDVHRIREADRYSSDYDATVARNVREQESDARPALANRLRSIDDYDVVVLASPLWNVRPPMVMRTFIARYDWTGKTVLPVTTYAVSGIGSAPDDYAEACEGARIGPSLAVRGERARDAGAQVDAWLGRARLQAA